MGLPDEYSIYCETCSSYNIQNGVIIDGKIYCSSCYTNSAQNDKYVIKSDNIGVKRSAQNDIKKNG